MAYLNGFFYSLPKVGTRYIFLEAADLWRGSDDISVRDPEDDLEYMFPENRATGVITKIKRHKSFGKIGYKLWIEWDGKPLRESTDTEGFYYHTAFVTLLPYEVPRYLVETRKVCIGALQKTMKSREKALTKFSKELLELVDKSGGLLLSAKPQ
jgi:hypothetical protein